MRKDVIRRHSTVRDRKQPLCMAVPSSCSGRASSRLGPGPGAVNRGAEKHPRGTRRNRASKSLTFDRISKGLGKKSLPSRYLPVLLLLNVYSKRCVCTDMLCLP